MEPNPIKSIRKNLFAISQAEFGNIAGVNQSTVARWESGQISPTLYEIARIRGEAILRGLRWDDSVLFTPDTSLPAVASAQHIAD
jgi:predicted transcriptional regulator